MPSASVLGLLAQRREIDEVVCVSDAQTRHAGWTGITDAWPRALVAPVERHHQTTQRAIHGAAKAHARVAPGSERAVLGLGAELGERPDALAEHGAREPVLEDAQHGLEAFFGVIGRAAEELVRLEGDAERVGARSPRT